MTDKAIKEMLFERSEESISKIDETYGARCRKIALDILGNEQDAEECVNDAYFTVWSTVPPEDPVSFFGYLYKILRNISLKKYRANNAQKRNSHYSEALDEIELTFASEESVEGEMDKQYFREVMDEFLSSLNEENRITFIKRYWFAQSCREIAKELGTTEKNITVRLFRTRDKLRKFLEEKGVEI
jgi:RNA polymerase sigma-70 factor (ECF subfamily)